MQIGRALLSSLLNTLSAHDNEGQQNKEPTERNDDHTFSHLTKDTPEVRNALVTLHFLFPHELLPALDLIDRGLITHLRWSANVDTPEPNEPLSPPMEPQDLDHATTTSTQPKTCRDFFFVRSASALTGNDTHHRPDTQSTSGRFRNAYASTKTHYEVDLDGWNCSCPAFAYSSIQLLTDTSLSDNQTDVVGLGLNAMSTMKNFVDGRATKPGSVVPVCKHILAICLCRASPRLFGDGLSRFDATREEIAGWIAA